MQILWSMILGRYSTKLRNFYCCLTSLGYISPIPKKFAALHRKILINVTIATEMGLSPRNVISQQVFNVWSSRSRILLGGFHWKLGSISFIRGLTQKFPDNVSFAVCSNTVAWTTSGAWCYMFLVYLCKISGVYIKYSILYARVNEVCKVSRTMFQKKWK